MDLPRRLAVARGDEPADLLFKGGLLVNVLSGEIYPCDVAVQGPWIVGLGEGYRARQVVELNGRYLCPGFIDAHVHVESAMVPPSELARAVVPRGVTTIVSDPHEIANVLGIEGIRFMLQDGSEAPFTMYVNAPSCVPASHMESSATTLAADDLTPLLTDPRVLGLAEVMSYPGVVDGDERVLEKLDAFRKRPIDGHAPGLRGPALNAYATAGITSDHEAIDAVEAREKLRVGMFLFLREATVARNLEALLPMVTPENVRRLGFCTDDRHPPDLLEKGSIDDMVRTTIGYGIDPVSAIRMATINTAEHYRLWDRGAIVPGRRADLLLFSNLEDLQPEAVYVGGRLVARKGELPPRRPPVIPPGTVNTIHIDWSRVDFTIPEDGRRIRAVGIVPGQLLTDYLVVEAAIRDGRVVADTARDLVKMAVIERHRATGNMGLGFVQGTGLRRGAIASTVAHDHHNLIVIGVDDRSMMTAARAVASAGGGKAVADGRQVLALLPLPIAGLLSDRPIEEVCEQTLGLAAAARDLGSPLPNLFMTAGFLSLEVVPSLKLTDLGLVDVDRFELVPLFPGEESAVRNAGQGECHV